MFFANFKSLFFRRRDGAISVEAALVLPMFLAFLMGSMSLAHIFWVRSSMEYAVGSAGRYLMLNTSASDSTITAQVRAKIYGFNSSNVNVAVTSTPVGGITSKTITATYSYQFLFGYLRLPSLTISAETEVPLIT